MLLTHFEIFSDLLKQYVNASGDEAHEDLVGSDRLQPSQLSWLKANGFLEGRWASIFINHLAQGHRSDVLQTAYDSGMLSQATQQQKNLGLQYARLNDNADLIRIWLEAGANLQSAASDQSHNPKLPAPIPK
jgi:hypothetical protein